MSGLIVHEWVAESGGSERVVDELIAAYPDADLQVLWSDVPNRYGVPTYETWLARTSLRKSKPLALPFMLPTWRNLPARQDYDWLLVSSHLFAHHAKLRNHAAPKFVYAHTPARYIWSPELDQRGDSIFARTASTVLKPLDRKRAREPIAIAANSEFTRARIQRAWMRDADVIYPPVDTAKITAVEDWRDQLHAREASVVDALPETFLLGASRFVPYKRLDLVIEAGEALGLPVVLAGGGPDQARLSERASIARVPVSFVDRPGDALLYALFQRAAAYIFPAIEDFGIMPVEAMATGTPVIAPHVGGASESVTLLDGGATVREWSPAGWREAFDECSQVDRGRLRTRVDRLSAQHFRSDVRTWLNSNLSQADT